MASTHSRPPRSIAPRLLPALLALAAACTDGEGREARRVVVITCDTLRADRLGMYGHERDTSRELDRFAEDAVVHESAWCTVPVTVPALSSMFTGWLPHEIGSIYTNRNQIPTEVETLAETVRAHGIDTAAFVSNGVLRRPPAEMGDVGLAQGFDLYDDEMNSRELQRPIVERTAADCADATLRWLEGRKAAGDDEFFLWVHFQDPHGPYTPPKEADVYRGASDGKRLAAADRSMGVRGAIPAYQFLPEESSKDRKDGDPARYADLYDAEIRWFDQHAGRVLQWLRDQGWYDDALIIFTADHGESLGERGWWFCHGESLHAEQVRVPLVLRAPGGKRPEQGLAREPRGVSHLDVHPTVLDAFGIPAKPTRGVSLLAGRPPAERPISAYLANAGKERPAYAIGDGRWRLVVDARDPLALHDLSLDPAEREDLSAARPGEVARLQALHEAWFEARSSSSASRERPMDAGTRRAMSGLGYTDGDGDGH
ncbi:MAG: sulfatase [Planctomycetia bacterium]